jgi:chromosome segregation ATPase
LKGKTMNATNENERSALVEKLEQASAELAASQEELDQLRGDPYRKNDRRFESSPRERELSERVTELEAACGSLRDQAAFADKISAYRQEIERSVAKARSARDAADAAEKLHGELTERIARLNSRIEALREGNRNTESQAAGLEADAARRYANAISSGNQKAEKAALAEMQKTQEAVSAVRSGIASNAIVITALVTEVELLEQQAASAKGEMDAHRAEMYEAVINGLRGEWDGAVSLLADIGARLVKAYRGCNRSNDLYDLHIPVFDPSTCGFIDDDTLSRLANELTTDGLDLLAVEGGDNGIHEREALQ